MLLWQKLLGTDTFLRMVLGLILQGDWEAENWTEKSVREGEL